MSVMLSVMLSKQCGSIQELAALARGDKAEGVEVEVVSVAPEEEPRAAE